MQSAYSTTPSRLGWKKKMIIIIIIKDIDKNVKKDIKVRISCNEDTERKESKRETKVKVDQISFKTCQILTACVLT